MVSFLVPPLAKRVGGGFYKYIFVHLLIYKKFCNTSWTCFIVFYYTSKIRIMNHYFFIWTKKWRSKSYTSGQCCSEKSINIRHIALNLLKKEKTLKTGIANKGKKAGWDRQQAFRKNPGSCCYRVITLSSVIVLNMSLNVLIF